ncbi:hypothetical protein [uncultured Campylobacter sp.]|uniref:hypothetical protein n=1 Tax=uncultured Campylobacter sp. TaxID=218934 RepID=UPI0026268205|nr:hypothetical protein [uncultured Campylobacter sp.]
MLQCGAKPNSIGPCVAQNSIAAHRTYRIGLRAGKILAAPNSHARVQIPQAKYRTPSRMGAAVARRNQKRLASKTLCKPKRAVLPHIAKRQSPRGGKIATQRERDEILTQAA